MGGSGLEALWETVYASNSVTHMLTGHAYTSALHAYFISAAAITSLLLKTPGLLADIDLDKIRNLHASVMTGGIDVRDVCT